LRLPSTEEDTQAYRAAEDVVAQCIAECCELDDDYNMAFAAFKKALRQYLRDSDIREQYTDNRIGRSLQERGLKKYESSGTRYRSVRLNQEFASRLAGY